MNQQNKRIFVSICFLLIAGLIAFAGGQGGGGAAELTIMETQHFIGAYETEFTNVMKQYEAANPGVRVRKDVVAIADQEIKLTSEAEAKRGHDIVGMRNADAMIYKDILAPLDDLYEKLIAEKGEPLPIAKEYCYADGHWIAISQDNSNGPSRMLVRMDLWNQVGYSKDMIWDLDWDKFIDATEKLYDMGHPWGSAVSQYRGDTHHWIVPFLWSFGSHISDENSNVAIDSQNTYAALQYAKRMYKSMDPGVIAWDEGGDNRYMLSGVGSTALSNGGSIWSQALDQGKEFADQLVYTPNPMGPAGRFVEGFIVLFGVWGFSDNIEEAKDFLHYFHSKEVQDKLLYVARPTGFPTWKDTSISFPEPQIEVFSPPIPEEAHHAPGWPGPVSQAAAKVWRAAILPVMMGKVFTGMPIQEALDWGEKEIEAIFAEERANMQ